MKELRESEKGGFKDVGVYGQRRCVCVQLTVSGAVCVCLREARAESEESGQTNRWTGDKMEGKKNAEEERRKRGVIGGVGGKY